MSAGRNWITGLYPLCASWQKARALAATTTTRSEVYLELTQTETRSLWYKCHARNKSSSASRTGGAPRPTHDNTAV